MHAQVNEADTPMILSESAATTQLPARSWPLRCALMRDVLQGQAMIPPRESCQGIPCPSEAHGR